MPSDTSVDLHCYQCGDPVEAGALWCPNCRSSQLRGIIQDAFTRSDPIIATLLSIVAPGLGHAYIGQTIRGVIIAFAVIVGFLLPPLGAPVAVFIWLYSIYDIAFEQ